jgi:O-antigen ligase
MGSSGMSGEVQMILISLRASGAEAATRCRSSLLLVAAATCLFATAIAFAWWLPLRTVLKQLFGSMLFAAKM